MTRNLGPGRAHESETASSATPVGARPGRHFGVRSHIRPIAGMVTVVAIVGIVVVAVALFRGDFSQTIPVTVISQRAGLVMNPDAKVKMNDIQVGTVSSIDQKPDGTAELHLAMDRSAMHLIPSNVSVDVASSTVFGAKFVELTSPPDPSPTPLRPGQVIEGDHVTVEINTVFEQLTSVLSTLQPEKLNQTLSALSSAFGGRGEKMGQIIADLDATLAELDPSLDNLSHDMAVAPTVLNTYADAATDLLQITEHATSISKTVVERQKDLDALLVSAIGISDIGNDVLTTNHRPLADTLHLLAPVTDLTRRYDQALYCALAGAIELAKVPPARVPGAEVMASLVWGADPYRYPSDLPKVAATGGPQCVGLPRLPYETRPPYVVADVGTNPWEYGHPGISLNAAGIKEYLLGHPIDGPPRNSAQIGMPG
ncbi:MCE family protein [Mycobacterium sp. OAE908]